MKKLLIGMALVAGFAAAFWAWGSTTNSYQMPVSNTSTNVIPQTYVYYTNTVGSSTNVFTNAVSVVVNTLWIRVVGDDFYCDTDPSTNGATTSSAFYPNGTILEWDWPTEAPKAVHIKTVSLSAIAHVQRTTR